MKKMALAAICGVSLLLVGCSQTYPLAVTSNPVGNKCGEASATRFLWIPTSASSNYGVERAAKSAGITKISHVDVNKKTFLFGLWSRQTTRVYGE